MLDALRKSVKDVMRATHDETKTASTKCKVAGIPRPISPRGELAAGHKICRKMLITSPTCPIKGRRNEQGSSGACRGTHRRAHAPATCTFSRFASTSVCGTHGLVDRAANQQTWTDRQKNELVAVPTCKLRHNCECESRPAALRRQIVFCKHRVDRINAPIPLLAPAIASNPVSTSSGAA